MHRMAIQSHIGARREAIGEALSLRGRRQRNAAETVGRSHDAVPLRGIGAQPAACVEHIAARGILHHVAGKAVACFHRLGSNRNSDAACLETQHDVGRERIATGQADGVVEGKIGMYAVCAAAIRRIVAHHIACDGVRA